MQSPTSEIDPLLALIRDPRLAPHALSALPVWLWRADATAILWANAAGAAIFGAPNAASLRKRIFDAGQPSAAQIGRLAPTLLHAGPPRLERLRGFGAGVGKALTCNCTRLVLADSTSAILVVAAEPAGSELRFAERAQRLLDGVTAPAAIYSADGRMVHATRAGSARLAAAALLTAINAGSLGAEALANGRAVGQSGAGLLAIDVIGSEADTALLLTFPPAVGEVSPVIVPIEPPAEVEEIQTPVLQASPAPVVETQPPPPPSEPAAAPETQAPETQAPVTEAPAPVQTIQQPAAAFVAPSERRHPLRFVWQMDADGLFTLASDEFAALIGPHIAGALGRPWTEVAAELALDPEGQVAAAIATRNTWSGIVVQWPVEGADERLPIELSGLPSFDRDRTFLGYRGFGVCRDVEQLATLAKARRSGAPSPAPSTPANVLRFPTPVPAETKPPVLSPVEHSAFREIGRQLSDRLLDAPHEPRLHDIVEIVEIPAPANDAAKPAEPPVFREAVRETPPSNDRPLLDRLPVGVLVYRFDHLLYANRAFLEWTGYADLAALSAAGGLDSLFIEPGDGGAEDQSGRIITISNSTGGEVAVEGRLFSVPWQGEQALTLILVPRASADRQQAADAALSALQAETTELKSIIAAAGDGVVIAGRDGGILSASAGAERLFGDAAATLIGQPLADLLTPADGRILRDAVERIGRGETSRGLAAGIEVTGRVRPGGEISLLMTLAPVAGDAGKTCAVFRDITRWKRSEQELLEAKREAERASAAKSAFLAKISHEIRTPLNAIIGFSEVMMAERFGAIGNERYRDYLKDIHASGEHVVSLLNDLLDLSKIEAGKMDLTFTSVGLNDLTQQCVALMQPQANRERIIIRTSLAARLPQIVADARSVKQIVLNLLSNSIKFTGAGGQVIVSSAINDNGQVVLRVRDTGVGMSEEDIAVALEPFRQLATSARWGSGGTGLGLPLTKALAEANHANFSITSGVNAGTLVEVAFPSTKIPAE